MINYKEYINSMRWAGIAAKCKQRDGQRCRCCNSREFLEVHHRCYDYLGREEENNMEDLITLCNRCHSKLHDKDPRPVFIREERVIHVAAERKPKPAPKYEIRENDSKSSAWAKKFINEHYNSERMMKITEAEAKMWTNHGHYKSKLFEDIAGVGVAKTGWLKKIKGKRVKQSDLARDLEVWVQKRDKSRS